MEVVTSGNNLPFKICVVSTIILDSSVELYSDAKVVLIVEKEATFQRLMNDCILQKLQPCIVITVCKGQFNIPNT